MDRHGALYNRESEASAAPAACYERIKEFVAEFLRYAWAGIGNLEEYACAPRYAAWYVGRSHITKLNRDRCLPF